MNEAEELGRTLIEINKRALGENRRLTLNSMKFLAAVYRSQGRIAETNALDEEVVTRRQNTGQLVIEGHWYSDTRGKRKSYAWLRVGLMQFSS